MELTFEQEVKLSQHTTFQVGGAASLFVCVQSEIQLEEAVTYALEHSLSVRILGGGSNVLAADEGFSGLIIKNKITGRAVVTEDDHSVELTVGAGEVLDSLVEECVSNGYWGIENLSHIPGTVGAAPIQNVGAYGVEIESVVKAVRAYHLPTQTFKNFTAAECAFQYRDSLFKSAVGREYVVTSVTFVFSKEPKPNLTYKDLQSLQEKEGVTQKEIREAVIQIRSTKFPDWHIVGTAGSFFKNPVISASHFETLQQTYPGLPGFPVEEDAVKVPLGWILDNVCGLRGLKEGRVGSYEGQALVLVNYGNATATEIKQFAEKVSHQVLIKTKIAIEWEVTQW